ncbi:MAG: glycosyltransferase family 2 protein [Anaerolineae bacterium]
MHASSIYCAADGDRQVPLLSVIIASYNARETIGACLRALEGQAAAFPYEVIVADSSQDGTAELVAEAFPWVRLVTSAQRTYCGEARNRGIAAARGEILAFLDADCTVGPEWAEAVRQAHQAPDLAIGGVIANGSPTPVGWAYYLLEFSRWLPRPEPRRLPEIAGCCLSLKRAAFARYGPFLEGTYCSDTAFLWRLTAAEGPILCPPNVVVRHHVGCGLGAFRRHEAAHGRSYARVRMRRQGLSTWKLAGLIAGGPLLPLLLFARIVGRVLPVRTLWTPLWRCWPALLWGLAAWSWGEVRGYLGGGTLDRQATN